MNDFVPISHGQLSIKKYFQVKTSVTVEKPFLRRLVGSREKPLVLRGQLTGGAGKWGPHLCGLARKACSFCSGSHCHALR